MKLGLRQTYSTRPDSLHSINRAYGGYNFRNDNDIEP